MDLTPRSNESASPSRSVQPAAQPAQPVLSGKDNNHRPSHGKHILIIRNGLILKHTIIVSTNPSSSSSDPDNKMVSTSTSPAPMRRHRVSSSGIRKHTIPFGLMCRKIRENGGGGSGGAKKQRIVLRRSSSQSSQ